MSGGLGYLTAVYRDGRVYIGSKSYAAGIFAAHLLNRYYRNDTAARIAVFRQSNWNVQEQLAAGYLSSVDFVNAGEVPKSVKDLNQFQEFQLAQGMIYEIYVKFGDGVTTVTFPSAISKIAGINVATEGTSDFIIAAKPGANHFNLVARKKGADGRAEEKKRAEAAKEMYSIKCTV